MKTTAMLLATDARRLAAIALFAVGYPVAIVVILRFLPVVRERRHRWFGAHQLAVAAIVMGHALRGRRSGVIVNGAWFGVAAVWYWLGARRTSLPTTRDH